NPSTTIEFNLPLQSQVSLEIYDILGRKLETIVSENLSAGEHSYRWDATRYSSGVYIYRLSTTKNVSIKKMSLIK
ncbi:MAG: T9SS type A sorting domain-containing protein, partial [Balneola sp.]